MNKMNLFAAFTAAESTNAVVDHYGNEFNSAIHPLMGVVPVKSVQILGNVLYVGYLAEHNAATTEVNTVIDVYAEEVVVTANKAFLYGVDNKYITAIVVNGDYNKVVDEVANNNLRIRVVRG